MKKFYNLRALLQIRISYDQAYMRSNLLIKNYIGLPFTLLFCIADWVFHPIFISKYKVPYLTK